MSGTIAVGDFRGGLLTVLEELFEQVHGYLLDPGISLFETLATISAEEASRPISAQSANLAAQVNHVRFYLNALLTGPPPEGHSVDWSSSWRMGAVTDEEWQDLIARLRATYGQLRGFATTFDGWDARFVGGAFAMVGHCAYHLGEIRQGLGVLRGAPDPDTAR